MSDPKTTVAQLIEILQKQDPAKNVQFLVLEDPSCAIMAMDLRADIVNPEKLMKSFIKPKGEKAKTAKVGAN